MVKVAPSVLSADFSRLGQEIKRIAESGADLVHLDVMDGHFVPNLTFGVPVIKHLRPEVDIPFDVHLMVDNPDLYIEPLAAAGADMVTVHAEATCHLHRSLQLIREKGMQAGVALNPATPLDVVEWVLPQLDLILVMGVNPGFGGQEFIPFTVDKVAALKGRLRSLECPPAIAVDGGMNNKTAALVTAAGADIIVAGSSVYGSKDIAKAIASLRGQG